jgi:hypothetical protein
MDLSISRWGAVAESCELHNEVLGYIEGGKFLEWLSACQILKEDFAISR